MGVSIFASQACCEEHNMQMSDKARDVIANPKGTLQSRGVVSLQDYVVEEQEMYNWLFKTTLFLQSMVAKPSAKWSFMTVA